MDCTANGAGICSSELGERGGLTRHARGVRNELVAWHMPTKRCYVLLLLLVAGRFRSGPPPPGFDRFASVASFHGKCARWCRVSEGKRQNIFEEDRERCP